MHIAPGDEGGIERRVVGVAHPRYLAVADGKHTGLAIAIDLAPRHSLNDLLRTCKVGLLRLPVVHTVTRHFVTFVHDALHHLGSVLSKIAGAEEGGFHAVGLQYVQDAVGALARHLHAFFQ